MTVTVQISEQFYAQLRKYAAEVGKSPEECLRNFMEQTAEHYLDPHSERFRSRDRIGRFWAWLNTPPYPDFVVDDSRDSIYE